MASLNVESLRRKLVALQNTQDSIQTLSLWIVHHKNHYRQIVEEWMEACRNTPKSSRRLTLFYLANDVLQNSKRKGATVFLDAFAEALEEAACLCRDEAIRKGILRIFKIWEDRNIYETDFCEKLNAATVLQKKPTVKPKPKENTKIIAEYKPEAVPETIEELMRFEAETELKCKQLNNMSVDVTNTETITKLKDRAGGKQFSKQFDEAATKLDDYVQSLTKEVEMRKKLVDLLDKGEIFYEAQNSEAKIVAHAYKNFGTRVGSLKRRLDEYKKLLPDPTDSPMPSPASDAPSPGATPPRDPNADTMEVEDMELSDEDGKQQGTIIAAPAKTTSYKPLAANESKQPMPALPGIYPVTTIGDKSSESYTPPGSPPSPEGSPIALSPPSLTPPSLTPPEEKKKKKRSHKHRKDHKRDHHHHKRSRRDRRPSSTDLYTPSPEALGNHHSSRTSTPSSKSDSKGEERVGTPVRDELDTQQNKEKLIKEATTNPIEFLTKLINKSQQVKGKKSAQSTSFINSLTVLSKNVKRLEAAKQAETNYELHKTMPLESTPPTVTTAVKSKSPVTTGSSVVPFSVSTVAESVEEDKFKDHLAAHALSVGHIMKALKEGKPSPPPPPPPPVSSMVGGFAPVTCAPVLYTSSSSSAPVNYTPVVTSAPGHYTPVTSAPVRFPAPNNDIQIIGETPPEVQVIGINPPQHATGIQAPSHITGVPPPDQLLGAPHPVGPPPPQPVAPVSYANPPITPTHAQQPPFSAPNEPYLEYTAGPSYPQPSPGPSPGPSPDQQIQPPFSDQPVGRPPPDQNMEPLFPQQHIRGPPPSPGVRPPFSHDVRPPFPDPSFRGPPPNQDVRPPFPEPTIGGPSPNQDIRPPFSEQNVTGPPHGVRLPFSEPSIRGLPPNLDIRPPFSQQNVTGPSPDVRPPFSEPNIRGPPPNLEIRPQFSHQHIRGPSPDVRPPFSEPSMGGPPSNMEIRPPFTQQNIIGPSPDVRPPFSEPNMGGPPSNLEIRPPFSQQNVTGPAPDVRPPFSEPNMGGPPPNQDIRPPFTQHNIVGPPHDVRPPFTEHNTGGPPSDLDLRVPFPHQDNRIPPGDQDMRPLFPHLDGSGPPQDQDMRPSFPPPDIQRPPPEQNVEPLYQHQPPEHQGAPQPFDQDMRQPYTPNLNSGDQDMRQPFGLAEGQHHDHDMRQIHRQQSTGEQPPEQPYDPGQPIYDPEQSYADQSYSEQPYSEQPYSEQPYSEQPYSDQPYNPSYSEHYPQQSNEGHQQEDQPYDPGQPLPAEQFSANQQHHMGPPFHEQPPPDHFSSHHEQFTGPPPHDPFGGPQSDQPHGGPPHQEHHISEAAQPIQALSNPTRPRSILKKRKPENIVSLRHSSEERTYEDPDMGPPHTQNMGAPLPFHLLHAPPPPPEEPEHSWSPSEDRGGLPPSTSVPTVPDRNLELQDSHQKAQSIKVVTSSLAPVRMQRPGPPPGPPPASAKRLSGAPPPPPGPPPANARRRGSHEPVASNVIPITDEELTEMAHLELEQALEMSDSIPRIKPSKTLVQIPITPYKETDAKEPAQASKPILKSALKKEKPVSLPPILKSALKKIATVESSQGKPPVSVQSKAEAAPAAPKQDDSKAKSSKSEPNKSEPPKAEQEKSQVPKTDSDEANVPASKQTNAKPSNADSKESKSTEPEPSSPIPVLGNRKKGGPAIKSQISLPPSTEERPGFRRHSEEIGAGEHKRPDYNRSRSFERPEDPNVHSIQTVGQRRRNYPDRPFDRHRDRFEGRFDRNFGGPQFSRHDNAGAPDPEMNSMRRNDPMGQQIGTLDRRPDRFQDRGMGGDYERFSPSDMGHEQFGRGPPKRRGPPMMGGPPPRRHPPPFYRY